MVNSIRLCAGVYKTRIGSDRIDNTRTGSHRINKTGIGLCPTEKNPDQGPVSRKPRIVFGAVKPFLDRLYLKLEKCIRSKLLV